MDGTLTRIVGRYRAMAAKTVSAVLCSGNCAEEAPTENGKNRLMPVAYPKNNFGTEIVMSSEDIRSTPWPYNVVVLTNDRCDCTTPLGRPVVPPLNSHIAASSRCESKGANSTGRDCRRAAKSALPTVYSRGGRGRPAQAS